MKRVGKVTQDKGKATKLTTGQALKMMIDGTSGNGSTLDPTVEASSWRRGSLSASSTSGRDPARQRVRAAMAVIPAAILASRHAAPAVVSVKGGLHHPGAATAAAAAGVVGHDDVSKGHVLRPRGAARPSQPPQ